MKITISLLTCFLLFPLFSEAQSQEWRRSFEHDGNPLMPIGWLEETDETLLSAHETQFSEVSHYGEAIDQTPIVLTGTGPSFLRASFFWDSRTASGGTPIYLQANRDFNNLLHVTVFDESGLLNELALPGEVNANRSDKGPGQIGLDNDEFWVFGDESFHRIKWQDNNDIDIIDTQAGGFGLIAQAALRPDGYILCNEAGYLIAVDENAEVVWSKEINARLMTVSTLTDGYIVGGAVNDSLILLRTDLNGDVVWQKQYDGGRAYDLVTASNGDFVITGTTSDNRIRILRTDSNGDLIWDRNYGRGVGLNIIESRYGWFYVQAEEGQNTHLMRLDQDGNTGDERPLGGIYLDINDVVTTTNASGNLFRAGLNDGGLYRVPKDSLTNTIFTSGLWMSGRDASDELYLSAQTYQYNWMSQDYQPGYIGSDPNQFDKVWGVSREQIEIFRNDQARPQKLAPWLRDIITWPAKGNPNVVVNGESVSIPMDLAPFVDVNGDGTYNAFDGDYPEIMGDQMLFWVMNDNRNSNVGGLPLGVDILCSMYAFSNEGVQNNVPATFVDFQVINRSSRAYEELTFGLFTDFALGCPMDDFIGSMPDAHAVYVYNADARDDLTCMGIDVASFNGSMPVQIAGSLNQEMTSSMYIYNGIISVPPGVTPPTTAVEYDLNLHGFWRDGSPLTLGGIGYNPTGTPTSYMFPDNPSDNIGWTMCSEGLMANERATVMNSAGLSLGVGDTIRYSIGQITLGSYDAPCPDVSDYNQHMIDIRDYFNAAWPDFTLDLGPDTLLSPGATLTLDAGPAYAAYDWSTGDDGQTLLVTSPGLYSVVATTPLGFQRTDTIRVDFVSNTEELDLTAPMIYPNPSQGTIFVEAGTVALQAVTVQNVLGQTIQRFPTTRSNITEIQLDGLAMGTYLLLIEGQGGKQWLRKILLTQ